MLKKKTSHQHMQDTVLGAQMNTGEARMLPNKVRDALTLSVEKTMPTNGRFLGSSAR